MSPAHSPRSLNAPDPAPRVHLGVQVGAGQVAPPARCRNSRGGVGVPELPQSQASIAQNLCLPHFCRHVASTTNGRTPLAASDGWRCREGLSLGRGHRPHRRPCWSSETPLPPRAAGRAAVSPGHFFLSGELPAAASTPGAICPLRNSPFAPPGAPISGLGAARLLTDSSASNSLNTDRVMSFSCVKGFGGGQLPQNVIMEPTPTARRKTLSRSTWGEGVSRTGFLDAQSLKTSGECRTILLLID